MPPDKFKRYVAIWLTCLQSVSAVTVNGDSGVSLILEGQYTSEITLDIVETTLTTVDKALTTMIPNVESLTFRRDYNLETFSEDALEGLTKLKTLSIIHSRLYKIPNLEPVKMTLTELHVQFGLITTIPADTFIGMEKLNLLKILSTQLTHIPNLSGLGSLQNAVFQHDSISSINVSYLPPNVTKFTLDSNREPIHAFHLTKSMPTLTKLSLQSNPSMVYFDNLFKGCHDLKILIARKSNLMSFPDLDTCAGTIVTVDLAINNIKVIPLERLINLTALVALTLNSNPIMSLPVMPNTGLPSLKTLKLSHLIPGSNTSGGPLSIQFQNVERIYLTNASLMMFPNISDQIHFLRLNQNNIRFINESSFSETSRLSDLSLEDNKLVTFPPIANLRYLTRLVLNRNPIRNITWEAVNPTNLSLTTLPLSTLYMVGVKMTDEKDLSLWQKLGKLEHLYMSTCQLTELPLYIREVAATLVHLSLDDNSITELNPEVLSGMTRLTYLSINRNQLTAMPAVSIKAMNSLTSLYLSGNHLTTLGDIMNSDRASLVLDLTDNRLVCDLRLCWMVNEPSISLSMDDTPCTAPTSLMSTTWRDVTRELLHCTGNEDTIITVSNLSPPFDLFVRRPGNMFTISSMAGYEDTVLRDAVKIPITFCSLECLKVGNACIGFVIESAAGNCWLMVDMQYA